MNFFSKLSIVIYKRIIIITSFSSVLEDDIPAPNMLCIYDDSFIDDYTLLTEKLVIMLPTPPLARFS